jgi:hypothetical protein
LVAGSDRSETRHSKFGRRRAASKPFQGQIKQRRPAPKQKFWYHIGMSEVTNRIFQCSEPVSGRIPPGTDMEAWSERETIRSEYLPRIAKSSGPARRELLCEFVAKVYDSWASRRFDLLASSKDLAAFFGEKETYFIFIIQPAMRDIVLTNKDEKAVRLTVAGRDSHWMREALAITSSSDKAKHIVDAPDNKSDREVRAGHTPVEEDSFAFGFEENGPPGQGLSSNRRQSVIERRTALLRAYKEKCRKMGIKATDSTIARAASPSWHDRTSVMRWKRNDPRSTPAENAKILAVLNKEPGLN